MHKAQQTRSSVVNVVIAEANHMNCELVETVLRTKRNRVAVIGFAVNSQDALSLVKKHEPDVAVISSHLQEGPLEGYRLLRELHSLQTKTHAIILLESRERELVIDAFRYGARGVVFRDEPLQTLGKCIHAVHQGQVWVNSKHLRDVVDALGQAAPVHLRDAHGIDLLSKREEDVVRLVAEGLTNREVSARLDLSEHTIRNYLFRIFDKLGVSSRVELVLYWLGEKQNGSTQE